MKTHRKGQIFTFYFTFVKPEPRFSALQEANRLNQKQNEQTSSLQKLEGADRKCVHESAERRTNYRRRETERKKNFHTNQTPSPHESDFRDDDGDQLLRYRRVETIRRNDHEHRDVLSLQGQTERDKRNQSN